jgi:hypothetical protein
LFACSPKPGTLEFRTGRRRLRAAGDDTLYAAYLLRSLSGKAYVGAGRGLHGNQGRNQ